MLTEEHVHGQTRLTDEEWLRVAHRYDHWAFVLIEDGHVVAEGPWLLILGAFSAEDLAHHNVRVMSHTDFVTRQLAALAAL